MKDDGKERDKSNIGDYFSAAWEHNSGRGCFITRDEYEGGLFMASNMDDTCEIGDALIDPKKVIVDSHGGLVGPDLHQMLGEGNNINSNELIWLTDRTPHQAIPQKQSGFCQFFRLVISHVTIWYEEHSTPNVKVPLPSYV